MRIIACTALRFIESMTEHRSSKDLSSRSHEAERYSIIPCYTGLHCESQLWCWWENEPWHMHRRKFKVVVAFCEELDTVNATSWQHETFFCLEIALAANCQPCQNSLIVGDRLLCIAYASQVSNTLFTRVHTPGLGCPCLTSVNAVRCRFYYDRINASLSSHLWRSVRSTVTGEAAVQGSCVTLAEDITQET